MPQKTYPNYKNIFQAHNGILRASAAIDLGIPKHILYKMTEDGELIREARGIYRLSETEPLGNPDLVQISLRVPRAVICLISALYFHELTTQIPHQIHFALPRDVKTPKIDYPPIHAYHFSTASYQAGITEKSVDGVKTKIYDREKTIADSFKFRAKIGIDIALEALKDYMREANPNISLLMKYAEINRVKNIMRPYLEALL